jgi:hypothetical protein
LNLITGTIVSVLYDFLAQPDSEFQIPLQMGNTDDSIAGQDRDFATPVKGKANHPSWHSSARKAHSSSTPLRGNQPKGTATCIPFDFVEKQRSRQRESFLPAGQFEISKCWVPNFTNKVCAL